MGLPPHPAWGAAPLCEVRPAEGQQGPGAGAEGGPEGTKAGGDSHSCWCGEGVPQGTVGATAERPGRLAPRVAFSVEEG